MPERDYTLNQDLDHYEQREERAYAMYRRQYQRQYPPPAKPRVFARMSGLSWIFLVIALAGSALAATRTVPVFVGIARDEFEHLPTLGAILIGLLALVVVDAGAILFRFASVYVAHQRAGDMPSITEWVKWGAGFALATQLIAQLYGVRATVSWLPNGVQNAMELVIASAAALSGMVLAFVTGEILAVLALQAQHDTTAAQLDYEADMAVWRDNLAHSWEARKGRYAGKAPRADGALTRADSRPPTKRRQSHDISARPPSPAELKAAQWLADHEDSAGLTTREVAELSGINRDAFSKARQRLAMGLSVPVSERTNGHRAGEGGDDA